MLKPLVFVVVAATAISVAGTVAGCGRAHMVVSGEVFERPGASSGETFSGKVVRAAYVSGKVVPMKGATVEVYQGGRDEWEKVPLARTETDVDGAYHLSFITYPYMLEKFFLLISRDGYVPIRREIAFVPGRVYTVDAALVAKEDADIARTSGIDPLVEIRGREREDPAKRPLDPMRVGYLSFLHQLVYIPPMESSYTMKPGWFRAQGGQQVFSQSSTGNGTYNRFKASVSEISADMLVGLDRRLDAEAHLDFGKIDTDQLNGVQLYRGNNPNDPLIGTMPVGFSLKGVGGRIRFAFWSSPDRLTATAISVGSNLGIGYRDFVSTGGIDTYFAFLASHNLGRIVLHGNLGYDFIGNQKVFTDDPWTGRPIQTRDVVFGGVSAVYPLKRFQDAAVVLQLQGNTNAFGDIDVFNGVPVTANGGARVKLFDLLFEVGGGVGLTDSSSDTVFSFNAGRVF